MIVHYEDEPYEIPDNARLYKLDASPNTGCAKAGRQHSLYRVNCYLTHCIHEDCDFQI